MIGTVAAVAAVLASICFTPKVATKRVVDCEIKNLTATNATNKGVPFRIWQQSMKNWMGPYQRTPKWGARDIRYSGLGVRSVGSVGDFLETRVEVESNNLVAYYDQTVWIYFYVENSQCWYANIPNLDFLIMGILYSEYVFSISNDIMHTLIDWKQNKCWNYTATYMSPKACSIPVKQGHAAMLSSWYHCRYCKGHIPSPLNPWRTGRGTAEAL